MGFFHRNYATAPGKWLPSLHSRANAFSQEDCSKRIRGLCVWNSSISFHTPAKSKQADQPLNTFFFASNNCVKLEDPVPFEKQILPNTATLYKESLSKSCTNKALHSINTYRNSLSCSSSLNQYIQELPRERFIDLCKYSSKTPQKLATNILTNNSSLFLQAQQIRSFSCSTIQFKTDSDAAVASTKVIDWNHASKTKLIDAQQKIDDAKAKLEDAKQNLVEEIHDTSTRMKEKMGDIIERENIFTIPNLMCMFRIGAAPFLCHLVVAGNYPYALGLFLLAGVTDLADGWIARMFPSQASRLGSFLDPLADKILVALVFLALTYNGMIPVALTGLIIYRDTAIIAAASYLRYCSLPAPRTVLRYFDATHATIQLAPTGISKLNTALQLTLITAALATPVFGVPSPEITTVLWGLTIGTTFASGLSYIFSNNTYKVLGEMKALGEQQQPTEEKGGEQQQNQR